jgi:DNA polymerase III alpha subunit (gram-positive type)
MNSTFAAILSNPSTSTSRDATRFSHRGEKAAPPFVAIPGLGEPPPWIWWPAGEKKTLISMEELSDACPKVSQTHLEQLKAMGALGELPETSQLSLFYTDLQ